MDVRLKTFITVLFKRRWKRSSKTDGECREIDCENTLEYIIMTWNVPRRRKNTIWIRRFSTYIILCILHGCSLFKRRCRLGTIGDGRHSLNSTIKKKNIQIQSFRFVNIFTYKKTTDTLYCPRIRGLYPDRFRQIKIQVFADSKIWWRYFEISHPNQIKSNRVRCYVCVYDFQVQMQSQQTLIISLKE